MLESTCYTDTTECMRYQPELHHRLATQWLLEHKRAALFLGCGLGKSSCVLQAFNYLRMLGEHRTMLVVAPLRVCNLTWPNEVQKWHEFRNMKVVNLRDGWSEGDVFLINWDSLHKLSNAHFDIVVFDELTKAKNPSSKRVNALRPLLRRDGIRWGLTGTPTPNSLMELFAQVRLLDDGERLGRSFDRFKRTYFYPTDYMEYNWEPFEGAEEKIYAKIGDLALTLRSSDYLHIPDTVVEDISVSLPVEARGMYKQLTKDLLLAIDGNTVVAQTAATLTNKLLQVTGGAVYSSDDEVKVVHIHDAKLAALRKYAISVKEPLLIACNYRHEQDRIQRALGSECKRFDEAKTPEAQIALVARWNSGSVRYLLCNPASVGHGLNLQAGGRTVVWYSLTWSGELYHQLNARLARKGQTQVTRVVRLISPGTMDDCVAEVLEGKDVGQRALLQALTNFRQMQALL